ncbi:MULTISPECIES: hypothetical protein [Enterobacter cloacae complex]|uniref:hypothetical protein n=1 Tax=Enterobacter cloacae complex TaxID=354276 RepID=UPI00123C397F|nr:hypothetical protein [Enterobacter roggenkampii]HCR0870452.1 hypothetical protein [Enterobacter roggenkampii]HCR1850681.1 hypothetical protein [Enterobacter roggenkampii]HCS4236406.1 hypothetical protein [Enterobacter roggenkampii]HEM8081297.1 hypothetical protein [Enterobacter roggenkampii]HEM8095882.1 hypothetical protein [Enterobacter roggenkampii]
MLSCSLKRELEMKLTENRVDTLIDTLNDLICDEQSITREQRENLIKTVATLGGLKERLRLISAEKEARQIAKNEKVKKPRKPDLVFPRTGKPWLPEDLDVIHSIIDDIPDDRIDDHILWLSKQQGRTPYAVALKIVGVGRMDDEWAKAWKPAAKSLREDYAKLHPAPSSDISQE